MAEGFVLKVHCE